MSPGKNLVVATTWLAWYVGIVVLDSDYAFTVTNVLVHGIPYLALVWVYGREPVRGARAALARARFRPGAGRSTSPRCSPLAWLEEWGWDRFVWHERPGLFPGPDLSPGARALALLVPLLALPQATHYVLDAWIWRTRGNPRLAGAARVLTRGTG